jgi:hypothetical protein
VGGQWQSLVEVTGNYQRLRLHQLEAPPAVAALRVAVAATNGADSARICEVRVYEETPGW